MACPVAASQTIALRSWLAEATQRPSGLKATPRTVSVCPCRRSRCLPVAGFHTLPVAALPAQARCRAPGVPGAGGGPPAGGVEGGTPDGVIVAGERAEVEVAESVQVVPLETARVRGVGARGHQPLQAFLHQADLALLPLPQGEVDLVH